MYFSLFWPKIRVHFRGKNYTFDKICAETAMNENIKKHHPKRIGYFKWQKFSAGWPKTSSNFKFCFLKVAYHHAYHMIYIQWLWQKHQAIHCLFAFFVSGSTTGSCQPAQQLRAKVLLIKWLFIKPNLRFHCKPIPCLCMYCVKQHITWFIFSHWPTFSKITG